MKNYHILLVRHKFGFDLVPRVRIRSQRFEQSVFIPYTNEPGEHVDPVLEAEKWLAKNGHKVIGKGELKDDYVLIVEGNDDGFKPLK